MNRRMSRGPQFNKAGEGVPGTGRAGAEEMVRERHPDGPDSEGNPRSPSRAVPGALGSGVRLDGFPPSPDCEPVTSWSPT